MSGFRHHRMDPLARLSTGTFPVTHTCSIPVSVSKADISSTVEWDKRKNYYKYSPLASQSTILATLTFVPDSFIRHNNVL